MIVEQRLYTFHPGKLQEFLRIYEAEAMAVQLEYLPHMLGYYVTEVGLLNQVTALWGYASMQDRMDRREALFADARWIAYLDKVRPLMSAQECRLLRPAAFFKQRLAAQLALASKENP
ncbi:NIPSNAP family protein [Variovorax terrae]|uniref:NIPSNAP family protein n=1 Tax=Variovorax terrae TaxID=2923278 RepID=A0A9X1VW75_9BURK|nr:NIPSNAP family protein [Variovorax terrae]MCJ0764380.1 NIPSNAP family protein [Variovorax terrae]